MLQWIPGHVRIMGNEYADQLAKKQATIKTKSVKQLELYKQINNLHSREKFKPGLGFGPPDL